VNSWQQGEALTKMTEVAAERLNDFDSKLVIKKLANLGEKNASREEVSDD
jgi:hypothetical protein